MPRPHTARQRAAPKTTSRLITGTCGHTERSRLTYPASLRTPDTSQADRTRWADTEFTYRARGLCSTCHATRSLPAIESHEAAILTDHGVCLPAFADAPFLLAVRARDLRHRVIDGALSELRGPGHGQQSLALTVLLAALSAPTPDTSAQRLDTLRAVHTTCVLHDIAAHTDPRYWLLRTGHGTRAYALGATISRDGRHLLTALAVATQPTWDTPEKAQDVLTRLLDRPDDDDLDLFTAGFADHLPLTEILRRRAFLHALTKPAPSSNNTDEPW